MITMVLALKALCFWFCMTSALGGTSEEMARDFIEQVLRVPNSNRVLNSVLGRLQRKQEMESQQQMYDEDCEEPPQVLPEYTESLQESSERGLRELSSQVSQKHYPICHLKRILRKLNTNEYEYRPAYYEEVRCSSSENVGTSNEICSSLGFSCIQWNKTIHLTRRRYSSDCWETRMMVIPAGCECMWPVHKLGDMALHQ